LATIEPVETEKEPNYYRGKIQRAEKDIERERHRRRLAEIDPEVALEKYQRAKKDLDSKLDQLSKIETTVKSLVADIKGRKKRWKEFCGEFL
jgi:chromosome segregation ATPase